MQQDTFQTILKLGDERFQLYRLSGHQTLMPDQVERIQEITARLATLWDQHRRDLAANSRETLERIAAQMRAKETEGHRAA